ncbi:hypothetical protein SAMN05216215_101851 [Saccharopolyspora shandongensis]|uniref:Uncharacterized protein n=1 Tax=Saccharopolyspora shandongensis TaxID=418495 RepID=A0A1H3G6Y8_9PSEU|nr:hypothetical protein [Saccharopolyspora shandongensis]SDX98398.1 hypothetical protein SAMN05216215_101851 [Saccharopolyspora shandongensis]
MSATDSVTEETRCPSVHGGRVRHRPRTTPNGEPVTMPYLDLPYGQGQRQVILTVCCDALLVPPLDEDPEHLVDCSGITPRLVTS